MVLRPTGSVWKRTGLPFGKERGSLDFFNVKSPRQALQDFMRQFEPVLRKRKGEVDHVTLLEAYGMVLATDLTAPEDIPPFTRSTVDGFAVRAKDTFGATESMPAILNLAGEVLMGMPVPFALSAGEAARIPTGGELPSGADAVAMLEYCELLEDGTLLISKPVSPGENLIQKGEDMRANEKVLSRGRRLGPYEIGALAACGVTSVPVFKPLTVGVISTGDEIVPPDSSAPGKIRDVNTYSISAALKGFGHNPVPFGIVPDEPTTLRSTLEKALAISDAVAISGGSSVGVKDAAVEVIQSLGHPGIIVHGVAVKPGKPLIIALLDGKPVFGLPGHPVSALTTLSRFVRPCLCAMVARECPAFGEEISLPDRECLNCIACPAGGISAVLSANIPSASGREDHVRVHLNIESGELTASPVFGKSGTISTLARSTGEVTVEFNKEGLRDGSRVSIKPA